MEDIQAIFNGSQKQNSSKKHVSFADHGGKLFQGTRVSGKPWVASRVDLVLGSNSQLRAISDHMLVLIPANIL